MTTGRLRVVPLSRDYGFHAATLRAPAAVLEEGTRPGAHFKSISGHQDSVTPQQADSITVSSNDDFWRSLHDGVIRQP